MTLRKGAFIALLCCVAPQDARLVTHDVYVLRRDFHIPWDAATLAACSRVEKGPDDPSHDVVGC